MKAAELHAHLDAALGPVLCPAGFRRARRAPLAYRRRGPLGELEVSIQCGKWGFDPQAGGEFFVNLRLLAEDTEVRHERLNHFLTDEELWEARELRDRVVARIPPPSPEYFEQLAVQFRRYPDGDLMLAAARAEYEPQAHPFRRHQDFGLRYRVPEDLVEWAEFLRRVLPRAVSEMEEW